MPQLQGLAQQKGEIEHILKEQRNDYLDLKEREDKLHNNVQGNLNLVQKDLQQTSIEHKIQMEVLKKEVESLKGIDCQLSALM